MKWGKGKVGFRVKDKLRDRYVKELSKALKVQWQQAAKLESGKVSKEDYNNWCCLLYTSPSPRDLSTSRMPSSA